MDHARLRGDMEYLAGQFAHRGANTVHERPPPNTSRDRFRTYTVDTEIDDFYSLPGIELLFAAYYAEFLVVALLSVWWPWIAFGYGAVVFGAYLGEFTGYDVLGRFWPQYQTQNVVARFMAPAPRRLFVVTAHYDSPRQSFFARLRSGPWPRRIHLGIVGAMVLVLAACAAQGLAVFEGHPIRYDQIAAGLGVFGLIVTAGALMMAHQFSEPARGAHKNASGVAALLALAERIGAEPPAHTDVWLVATGSKETGLHGMRRFVTTHDLDRESTFFINIDRASPGELSFFAGEGMLHVFRTAPDLLAAAEQAASDRPLPMRRWYGTPTDALIPLARGYKVIGLSATGEAGSEKDDRAVSVDLETVGRAVDVVLGMLRVLDAASDRTTKNPPRDESGLSLLH